MCGRFAFYSTIKAINKAVNIVKISCEPDPSYNIAPMSEALVVTDERELVKFKWGLVPYFSKDDKFAAKMINARSETIKDKPSFRNAYMKRRCVIPANGFFEWKRNGKVKEPFYIHSPEKELLLFAGIYEVWRDPRTFSILTKKASEGLLHIHDRMPAVLKDEYVERWLSGIRNPIELDSLIDEGCETEFKFHNAPLSVNSVKNNSENLVKPAF